MKRTLWIALFLASICGTALAAPPADEAKIISGAASVVNNIFAALKAHDWETMRVDFSDEMRRALPPEKLAAVFGELEKQRGAYVGNSFARMAKKDEWVILYYTTKFAKSDVLLQFTFRQGDPTWKIWGLFVLPAEPAARADKAEVDALLKTHQPIIDAYFAAYQARDFVGMEANFSDQLRQALPPAKLKTVSENDIEAAFGRMTAASFDRIETDAEHVFVYYHLKRARGQTVVKFVFDKSDAAHHIAGLWENPL